MSHLIAIDRLLGTTDQVFEEVNCDLLVCWQEDVGVNSQEVIALALASVLSSKRSSRDSDTSLLLVIDIVVLLSVHRNCRLIYD